LRLEEDGSERLVPEEGLDEVLVVVGCPLESLTVFTRSIFVPSALGGVSDGAPSGANKRSSWTRQVRMHCKWKEWW